MPFNSHGKCAITAKRLINAGPRPRVCLITHPVSTVAIVSPLFTPLLKLRLHCRLDPLAEEPALVRMVAFGVCRLCRKRCIRTDSKCDWDLRRASDSSRLIAVTKRRFELIIVGASILCKLNNFKTLPTNRILDLLKVQAGAPRSAWLHLFRCGFISYFNCNTRERFNFVEPFAWAALSDLVPGTQCNSFFLFCVGTTAWPDPRSASVQGCRCDDFDESRLEILCIRRKIKGGEIARGRPERRKAFFQSIRCYKGGLKAKL